MSSPLFYSIDSVGEFYTTIISFVCNLCVREFLCLLRNQSEEEVQSVKESMEALRTEKKCGEFVHLTCKYINDKLNSIPEKGMFIYMNS